MSGRDLAHRDRDTPAAPSQERSTGDLLAVEYAEELLARETGSRRTAWIVTAVLIVICAAQAAAIALMLPLKEIVPYTIVVDRTTGFAEVIRPLEQGALPQDQAITQAFLAQYVIARETFDAADLPTRYKLVALLSAETARADFVNAYRADNPQNLAVQTPSGTVRRVRTSAVALLDVSSDPRRASVDVEIIERPPGGIERSSFYRAQLGFRYSGAPMRMEDRLLNPLGLQVVTYRLDPAPLAPPPAPAPPDPAPAASTANAPALSAPAPPPKPAPAPAPTATIAPPPPPPAPTPSPQEPPP
jgi:type IV secretion system protein VirB8